MNSTIYQITLPNGKTYVGSTVTDPKQRWHVHKSKARNGTPGKLYNAMRQAGIDNCMFTILEEDEWNTTTMQLKENFWINKLKPKLNTQSTSNNSGRYPKLSFAELWRNARTS